jgi:hypothetical protein
MDAHDINDLGTRFSILSRGETDEIKIQKEENHHHENHVPITWTTLVNQGFSELGELCEWACVFASITSLRAGLQGFFNMCRVRDVDY